MFIALTDFNKATAAVSDLQPKQPIITNYGSRQSSFNDETISEFSLPPNNGGNNRMTPSGPINIIRTAPNPDASTPMLHEKRTLPIGSGASSSANTPTSSATVTPVKGGSSIGSSNTSGFGNNGFGAFPTSGGEFDLHLNLFLFFQFLTAPTNSSRLKAHSPSQTPQHPIRTAMPICQSNALMASVSARVCAIPFFYNFHFICSSNSNKSGSTERAGERQQHLGCRTREIAENSTQRSGCGTEGIQARQPGEEASAAEQNGSDTTPIEEAIGTEVVLNGRSDVMN